ncbi:MAG: hypothetical protein ACTSR8_06240 [Promethearchaeota archaeon]
MSKKRILLTTILINITILNLIDLSPLTNSPRTIRANDINVELSSVFSEKSLTGITIAGIIGNGETNPVIKYSTLVNQLQSRGATITTESNSLNANRLSKYNIIWIDESGTGLTGAEQTAVEDWILNGGSVIISGDIYGTANDIFTIISITTSVGGSSGSTSQISDHEITSDVSTVYFSNPMESFTIFAQPSAISCVRDNFGRHLIVAVEFGIGKVVLIADDTPNDLGNDDNTLLMNNIFGWLASKSDYHYTGGGGAALNNQDEIYNPLIGIGVVLGIIAIFTLGIFKFIRKNQRERNGDLFHT